jgi:hypothetical protein
MIASDYSSDELEETEQGEHSFQSEGFLESPSKISSEQLSNHVLETSVDDLSPEA